MAWVKPSDQTLAIFDRLAADLPGEPKKMFGMPCRFLHGNMFFGVFGNSLVLRLGPEDLEACLATGGARPFEPMGRRMREYVQLDAAGATAKSLGPWLVKSVRFVGALPTKSKKGRTARRRAAATPARKPAAKKPRALRPRR